MKITVQPALDERQDALVLGIFEEDKEHYKSYHKVLAQEIDDAVEKKIFTPNFGEMYLTRILGLPYKKIMLFGLGKKKEMTVERFRKSLGKAVKCVTSAKLDSFTTNITQMAGSLKEMNHASLGMATAEALILGNYTFTKYLSKEKVEKKKVVKMVSLQWENSSSGFGEGLKTGRVIAEATNYVKDLVNEPAGVANSLYVEKAARDIAACFSKVKINVLNEMELKKLGMNAMLGVNAGSDNPPKLVILEYNGGGAKEKYTAFVGKGITFDSGGYNLKPTKYIEEMKTDMAGAAAVLGTIQVAAELGLQKNLLGVMPLCENMVNGKAQRPGDIVKAYNGKTIEIGNTDAEGRLILADALAYTERKYTPEVIIDLATLTGACVVALGYYAAGLVSKDQELLNSLQEAGSASGDPVWALPFFEDYQDWMDGTISDLNNISQKGKGHEAGSITAGVFLSKFIEKARWAHIDIAGSAYWGVEGAYTQKGATGSGVRVLSYYLLGKERRR